MIGAAAVVLSWDKIFDMISICKVDKIHNKGKIHEDNLSWIFEMFYPKGTQLSAPGQTLVFISKILVQPQGDIYSVG